MRIGKGSGVGGSRVQTPRDKMSRPFNRRSGVGWQGGGGSGGGWQSGFARGNPWDPSIPPAPPAWRPNWRPERGYQLGGEVAPMGGLGALQRRPEEMLPGPDAMGNYSPGMDVMEESVSVSEGVPGGLAAPGDEVLVSVYMEAREALQGDHPNPEAAIVKFVELFGEEALIELRSMIAGGAGSDGMSDSIPANIDGQEEVNLSEGEFVVPADVVSGIGNGDTGSGARKLTEIMEEIRRARTGSAGAPEEIDAEEVIMSA